MSDMDKALGGGSGMASTGSSERGLAPSNPAPDAPRLPQTSGIASDDIAATPANADGVGAEGSGRAMGHTKGA